jgi:hypothetical protein
MGQEKIRQESWPTSSLAVAWRDEDSEMRLLLLGFGLSASLDTGEKPGCGDAQGIAEAEENVHRGRLLVVFQEADVGTVNARRKG